MTRFARAKGSKASNERKEEDPTPWHIMRQQLAEQLIKNVDDCENKSSLAHNTSDMVDLKPKEEVWFQFNEFKLKTDSIVKDTKIKIQDKLPKDQNKKTCMMKKNELKVDSISNSYCLSEIEEARVKAKTKHQNRMCYLEKKQCNESKTKNTIPKANIHSKLTTKNKSKQNKSCNSKSAESTTVKTHRKTTVLDKNEEVKLNNDAFINTNNSEMSTGSPRRELTTNKLNNLKEDTKTEQTYARLKPLEPFSLETLQTLNSNKNVTPNHSKNGNNEIFSLQEENNKKMFKKNFGSLSHTKSYSNVQTIIANGRKIEIVKFEAFWIKKEDARKLKELRKKLRDQKMPNDKIKTILKLERRKAEKSLTREKTNVCYHCRKFGHKLSECPEINDTSMSKSGICFKCGSTEHTHFECKVTHSQNFRYAVCFVCNEQGHIARQCSLNPQGQYPKGGSCHLCGEVTHLRKDCPKAIEEKPSSNVTVEKISSVGLEDVSEMKTINKKQQNFVKNNVVLFLK